MGNKRWRVEICLFKKRILEAGESWKRTEDGSKVLVQTDPDTGKESVVLTYSVPDRERVDLFEIVVDLATSEAVVQKSTDLESLDSDNFELFREEVVGD